MAEHMNRRAFIRSAAVTIPASLSAVNTARAAGREKTGMPTVKLGKYRVSRLIAGGNPINGGSHLSQMVNNSMREYFTDQRKQEFLSRCQAEGINTFQASHKHNYEMWEIFRKKHGNMQYFSLSSANNKQVTPEIAAKMGFIGLAHHGEMTDRLFKTGKIEQVREFLKKVRDAGLCVGLSTHMPDVVDHVEDKGWDLDFFMTCVYERHRSADDLRKLLGHVPIPVKEVYLEEDPPRMYKMIKATKKTCFAFKILAAGRLCRKKKDVAKAFEATFKNIKPSDGVIVGMFPRWSDQIKENAGLVRRFG
jgi:hypothetical protein